MLKSKNTLARIFDPILKRCVSYVASIGRQINTMRKQTQQNYPGAKKMRAQGVSKSSTPRSFGAIRNPQRKSEDVPAGYSRSLTSRFQRLTFGDHDLVSGIDMLGFVNGIAAGSNAATCFRVPCSPSFWTNTRVATESRLFGVYMPKKIVVHWQPAVGTTTAGAIIMGTLGVSNNIDGAYIPNALLASHGGVVSSIWKDCCCSMDLSGLTQKGYFLNDISEDGIPMNIYVDIPDNLNSAGYLWVEYVFEFRLSQTQQAEQALYSLVPITMTLTEASTALALVTGYTIGDAGSLTSNGSALNTYLLYAEAAKTNMIIDLGRVGTRHEFTVGTAGNTIILFDGEQMVYGKGNVLCSVYSAKPAGGTF